jgi:hypothetical protein
MYNLLMIITKTEPYTPQEIIELKKQFDGVYIKTVIDVENRICSAGCDRHFESEQILIEKGSAQKDIWGGGIDLETNTIDFNSFINIRPSNNNTSNEIQDAALREKYTELTKYFFEEIL